MRDDDPEHNEKILRRVVIPPGGATAALYAARFNASGVAMYAKPA